MCPVSSQSSLALSMHTVKISLQDLQNLNDMTMKKAVVISFRGTRLKGAMTLFVECLRVS